MKTRGFLTAVLCALYTTLAPLSAHADDDESAIKKSIAAYESAMTNHDAKLTATFWIEDGSLVDGLGVLCDGRVQIEKCMTDHLQRVKDCDGRMSLVRVRVRKPDVALADIDYNVACKGAPQPLKVHITTLFAKRDKKWMWADARVQIEPSPPAAAK